jgi:hypothetical protein
LTYARQTGTGLIEIPAESTRVLGFCGMKAEPQSSSSHALQNEFLNEDNQDHRYAEKLEIQAEQHRKRDETGGKSYWAYGCGSENYLA